MKLPAHLEAVAQLPCSVCGAQPVEVHHIRTPELTGAGQRSPDVFAIPLCPQCHRGDNGFHGLGRKQWEMRHGSQWKHTQKTIEKLFYGKLSYK